MGGPSSKGPLPMMMSSPLSTFRTIGPLELIGTGVSVKKQKTKRMPNEKDNIPFEKFMMKTVDRSGIYGILL